MNTREKGIPKRLGINLLRDAIVCLDFRTDYNEEKIRDEVLKCVNGMSLGEFAFYPYEQSVANKEGIIGFIGNETYKIMIKKGRLLFNYVTAYRGWDDYRFLVTSIMSALKDLVMIDYIFMEYIDILPNKSIVDKIDGDIHFNQFGTFFNTQVSFSCRTENKNGYESDVEVKIIEKKPQRDGSVASFVDVRVVCDDLLNKKVGSSMDWLDYCHYTQKIMFFSLLKEDFVNELKPEYE